MRNLLKNFKNLIGSGGLFKPRAKQSERQTPISDSGRSISFGEVIEVLCSGGKYGVKGLLTQDVRQSVFLDNTAIYTEGFFENYKGIQIFQRRGQPQQTILEGFTQGLISEHLVNSEARTGIPVTRSFVNQNTVRIRIRLSFVIMINVKDAQGNVINVQGGNCAFQVFIKQGGGIFEHRGNFTVTGKYSQPYERIWWFDVNPVHDEYFIRVEKVSSNDTNDEKRTINFISYSISGNILLPLKRMAYAGIKFNAEDLGTSIPERRYNMGGMYLDIPSNATVNPTNGSLTFNGNWNGIFKQELNEVCSDFFAIVWYLLTDEIDGMGDEIKPHMIDRYSLYNVSVYNNQMINNGFGGLEPRYLFDILISNQNDGWRVLDSLCSGCNTRYFWKDGLLTFTQDKPSKIEGIISNADVEKGTFVYSTIDLSDITTAIQVTYTDPEKGQTKQEFVSDVNLIHKYGYKFKQIEAVGCTRRSQAIRMGRSAIYSDSFEKEIVTFTCRGYAAYLQVGSIVTIADANRYKQRYGGIVKESTTSIVVIDYPIEIKSFTGFDDFFYVSLYSDIRDAINNGVVSSPYDHYLQTGQSEGRHINGYLLLCFLPTLEIQIRKITNLPGIHQNITVESPFTYAPPVESSFIILTPDNHFKLYRIESKAVNNEDSEKITLTCKEHHPFKYQLIERKLNIGNNKPTISQNNQTSVLHPTNLQTSFRILNSKFEISLNWFASRDAYGNQDLLVNSYLVSYRSSDLVNWSQDMRVYDPSYVFETMIKGNYSFRVKACRFNGDTSKPLFSYNSVVIN